MREHTVAVRDRHGLHARPAARFVEVAQRFKAELTISKAGRTVNAKSLIAILSLGVDQGSLVTLAAVGPDEQDAVATLTRVLESAGGEG